MATETHTKETVVENGVDVEISQPLVFWVFMLLIGVIIEAILLPLSGSLNLSATLKSTLTSIAGWLLYLPGSIIFPLIVSIWIGERVGALRRNIASSASIGFINAVYAALIYIVSIFIIYLIIKYITPAFLAIVPITTFVEYAIIIPVVIVIVLVPLVSAISAARHSSF